MFMYSSDATHTEKHACMYKCVHIYGSVCVHLACLLTHTCVLSLVTNTNQQNKIFLKFEIKHL